MQGIPPSRIDEWMQTLPTNKIPKLNHTDEEEEGVNKNSIGVAYREAQLLQQLPKQDLSLKATHHISQKDQSSYQDFICARNDIGEVHVLNLLANSVSQQGFSTGFVNKVSQLGFSTVYWTHILQNKTYG